MGTLKKSLKRQGTTFSKANITAFAATIADVGTLTFCVEILGIYYVWATALGAIAGAITNFWLNRIWAFDHDGMAAHKQGFRYALVAGGSLLLNTGLVFFFTEVGHLRYLSSKAVAALAVGWLWNYPLHRYFVFRRGVKGAL